VLRIAHSKEGKREEEEAEYLDDECTTFTTTTVPRTRRRTSRSRFGGRSAHGIIGFGIGFLVTIPSHVMKIYEE
jgi:hypothetical protein